MPPAVDPVVDIAFECLPVRSIGRLDIPLDASDAYRTRCERLKSALDRYGAPRTYYIYNARCIFRFANSEVDGVCRFAFEGAVRTDAGDGKTEAVDLEVKLISETCGGVPRDVEEWLAARVHQAVIIEFDRFIAAGRLADRERELGAVGNLADLESFAGMNV